MAKNIVLLSDGTGNSAAMLFRTNVWRVYQALDLRTGDQIASYDDGVGTESFRPLALLGGAVGVGLARNVRELYAFLCRNHQRDDRIFLFGFSRGAFTVRTLVGLIADQGIVAGTDEADLQTKVKAAWASYYARRRSVKSRVRRLMGSKPSAGAASTAPRIAFLGVWDTVAAYGLPVAELALALHRLGLWNLGFADRELSPIVERACHALALDDERHTFHPVLWNEAKETDPQRISQVWFAGAHSNVGGGYPKDELAHVALQWMMQHAEAAGLRFLPNPATAVTPRPDVHGEVYDSRSGFKAYYRYKPRRLDELCHDAENGVEIRRPKIHHSVLERLRRSRIPYASFNIPAEYEVMQPDGSLQRPGTPGADETIEWARWRARRQERAWDVVFWRRIVYFLIIAVSVAAALAPTWLTWSPRRACAGRLCVLDPVIGFVGAFLPAFADSWLTAFRQNPRVLVAFVALFAVLLWANAALARTIAVHAHTGWRHVRAPTSAPAPVPERITAVTRFRRSFGGAYRFWAREVIPLLAVVAVLVVVVGAVSRLIFDVRSSLGYACAGTPEAGLREPTREASTIVFATSEKCLATGLALRAGERYAVEVTVTAPWKDGTINASPDGFTSLRLLPALALRRIWSERWFRLMGRVGTTGDDHYPLASDRDKDRIELRARSTGELFLFVNDAVVGFLPEWDLPYRWAVGPNAGTARVEVMRLR